jgi:aminomethyltransferase
LLFFGYDMTEEHTPWEVGLGFTISRRKGDFRGRQAVLASDGRERFRLVGLVADTDSPLAAGDRLLRDGKEAGRVTSPAYSRRMRRSLALAHVHPEATAPATVLEVEGEQTRCLARVTSLPFHDPDKGRVRS